MKPLNCVIIEDNQIDRLSLEGSLRKFPFVSVTASYSNPIESIELLKNGKIDLLFIDIDTPVINGIDFLRSLPGPPHCIFVTVHPEFAVDAFDIQAVDYVLKPVRMERLDKAIKRALELMEITDKALQYDLHFENDFLMIKEGTSVSRVNVGDIVYLEALMNYTKVFTAKKRYITLNNLKSFLDHLPAKKFMRIHRSYAVAINKIQGLEGNELLIGEQRLPLGKTYRLEVKKHISSNE